MRGRGAHLVLYEEPYSPHVNLAVDEALLIHAACSGRIYVRLWRNHMAVVVGYSWPPDEGVDRGELERVGAMLLRRISGGGPVFHDLGNVNYSVYAPATSKHLAVELLEELVSEVVAAALRRLGAEPRIANRTDVVVAGFKVSGSAAAVRWGGVLVHGTLLVETDPQLVKRLTPPPPRPPPGVDPVKYRPGSLRGLLGGVTVEDAAGALIDSLSEYFGGLRPTLVPGGVLEAARLLARRHLDPAWVSGARKLSHYEGLVGEARRLACGRLSAAPAWSRRP